jgi:hypothetical protein
MTKKIILAAASKISAIRMVSVLMGERRNRYLRNPDELRSTKKNAIPAAIQTPASRIHVKCIVETLQRYSYYLIITGRG